MRTMNNLNPCKEGGGHYRAKTQARKHGRTQSTHARTQASKHAITHASKPCPALPYLALPYPDLPNSANLACAYGDAIHVSKHGVWLHVFGAAVLLDDLD